MMVARVNAIKCRKIGNCGMNCRLHRSLRFIGSCTKPSLGKVHTGKQVHLLREYLISLWFIHSDLHQPEKCARLQDFLF